MTPLVFLHGFMGGSEQWNQQASLSEIRRLIRLDLPGFGRNAHMKPIDQIEDFADWVIDQLNAMQVNRFDLLGHSMGGMIAQEVVHRAPGRVENLVLYATGARGVLPGRFETIEASMSRARSDGAVATARRISATWFLHGVAAPAYAHCADIAAQTRLPAIQAGLSAMNSWSGELRLPAIGARTLILWGDGDRTYPWSQIETLWRQIDGSHLAVVPNCAHAVHAEQPRLFDLLLEAFLTNKDQ